MIAALFLLLLVLAAVAGMVAGGISNGKKLRRRVLDQFGQRPQEDYPLEDIPAYCQLDSAPAIDHTTWTDLDMDLVFRRLNSCQSSVGEQVLYAQLHRLSPPARWEELLTHLEGRPQEREALWLTLARLGKRRGGYSLPDFLFSPVECQLPLAPLYPVLAWLPLACLALVPFLPWVGGGLFLVSLCGNVALYYLGKRRVQGDLDALGAFLSLLSTCRRLESALTLPAQREELRAALAPFRPLLGRVPGMGVTGGADWELCREYFRLLTLRDLRVYRKAQKLMAAHPQQLRALFESVGAVDMAVAVLSFRATLPQWCRPVFWEENTYDFTGLFHPLLREPVANSSRFAKDVLLTGSNASGKSTFLKALAVNAILGQSLLTCAAEGCGFRPGPVLTSMAVKDDISAGESYFMAEVRSLKRLTDAARLGGCLLFIDEILRGTNTGERLAASQAVLEELHRRDCLCVAATHDRELTWRLSGAYRNYHFQETLTADGVQFDYALRDGPANTQNAIRLLGLLGFPQATVRRAEELAEQGEERP